jgi:DNA-binding SARP family transcriptional activator
LETFATPAKPPLRDFVTRKTQALLIYLALTGQAHTREALARLFWCDRSDQQASNNLRTLAGSHLLIDRQHLQFDRSRPYWIDVERFATTIQLEPVEPGSTTSGIEQLKSALALYQGDFLAGFSVSDAADFEAWALLQREHLRRLAIQGFDKLTDLYLRAGQPEAALQATKQLLTLDPWYETAYYKQMVILAQLGQRTAALAQYELCRKLLADEFATQPSSALTTLYEQLKVDTDYDSLSES